MRKWLIGLLSLTLILSAAGACAESGEPVLETMAGLEWSFSSGVGAWSSELRIQPDGSFAGEYHDSEMGETGDNYPDGTVYGCLFHGKFSLAGQADEYSWKIRVDSLTMDEGQVKEAIEDGVRYVTAQPYGLSEGDEMLLYRPGTPVKVLSEEQLFWAHVLEQENPPEALETWFLSSKNNESGFVGLPPYEPALANPWEDLSAKELEERSGLTFHVPEGAENVIYRWLENEKLAEMQFTINEDEFTARLQPADLKEGEFLEISGMYFAWDNVEEVTVHHCKGTIGQAQCGTEDWVERVLWYDAAPGIAGCLSVYTKDLNGLDLAALAEQVYLPVQGDV